MVQRSVSSLFYDKMDTDMAVKHYRKGNQSFLVVALKFDQYHIEYQISKNEAKFNEIGRVVHMVLALLVHLYCLVCINILLLLMDQLLLGL
jgi:hypothetical protein